MKRILFYFAIVVAIIATVIIYDNSNRYTQFEQCINSDPTDAVCDSCWSMFYGHNRPILTDTIEYNRCCGITKKGTRCKHKIKAPAHYCWMHREIKDYSLTNNY